MCYVINLNFNVEMYVDFNINFYIEYNDFVVKQQNVIIELMKPSAYPK